MADTIGVNLEARGAERANKLLERFASLQTRIDKLAQQSAQKTSQSANKAIESIEKQSKAQDKAAKAAEKNAEKAVKAAEKEAAARKKAAADASKNDPLNLKRFLGGNQKLAESFTQTLSTMGQGLISKIPILGQFSSALGATGLAAQAMVGALALSIATIAALAVAAVVAIGVFTKLGIAGIRAQDTIDAFGNQVGALGSSSGVLAKLRLQTRGTVSDLELMRLSVQALRGTDATFRKIVGDQLGTIIDNTSRIARATGENAEVIREKFLSGLRLQSKLKLDDVGVTVEAEKAYAAYAEQIGKTASQLTELEKRAAFAQEAIRQLSEIGKGFKANKGAEALDRLKTSAQNVYTKLTLLAKIAFEPLIVGLADMGQKIEGFYNRIAPIAKIVIEALTEFAKGAIALAKPLLIFFFGPIYQTAREVFPYFAAVVVIAARALKSLGNIAQMVGNAISKALGIQLGKSNESLKNFVKTAAITLSYGGGYIIGAFARGLLTGATAVIRAVTFIAQIVADFLQGFSPPKKGPLSHIDEGGMNVAMAWAEGFAQGLTPTFDETLSYVDSRLGAIGKMSLAQVETRLGQLDLAIRPFEESLSIVKADMEAIAGFVDPALKVVEKQRDRALKAFDLGQGGDIEKLRLFDQQIDKLNAIKDLAEDQTNQAEVSLAYAKSQQAVERALLLIQKNRLGVQKDTEEAQTATGTAADVTEPATDNALPTGAGPDLIGGLGTDINAAIALISDNAQAGLEAGLGNSFDRFKTAQAGLAKQIDRIKSAKPGDAIKERLAGVQDNLLAPFTAAQKELEKILPNIFGESGLIGTFMGTGSFMIKLLSVGGGFQSAWNTALSFMNSDFISGFSTSLDNSFGLAGRLGQRLGTTSSFYAMLTGDGGAFKKAWNTSLDFLDSDYTTGFTESLDGLFTSGSIFDNAVGLSSTFYTDLTSSDGAFKGAWTDSLTFLDTDFFDGFDLSLSGLFGQENSLMFTATYNATELIGQIGLSFKGLGTFLLTQMPPLLSRALDTIASIFTTPIKAILSLLDSVITRAGEVISAISDVSSLPGAAVDAAQNTGSGLVSTATNALSNAANSAAGWLGLGRAAGGLNLPAGVYRVGEKGEEWVTTNATTNIFPNNFVKAVESMVQAVTNAPSPSVGNITNNNQRSMGDTVINVKTPQEAMLIRRQQMARGGV